MPFKSQGQPLLRKYGPVLGDPTYPASDQAELNAILSAISLIQKLVDEHNIPPWHPITLNTDSKVSTTLIKNRIVPHTLDNNIDLTWELHRSSSIWCMCVAIRINKQHLRTFPSQLASIFLLIKQSPIYWAPSGTFQTNDWRIYCEILGHPTNSIKTHWIVSQIKDITNQPSFLGSFTNICAQVGIWNGAKRNTLYGWKNKWCN